MTWTAVPPASTTWTPQSAVTGSWAGHDPTLRSTDGGVVSSTVISGEAITTTTEETIWAAMSPAANSWTPA